MRDAGEKGEIVRTRRVGGIRLVTYIYGRRELVIVPFFFKLYLGRGSASCSSWTTSVWRILSLRVRLVS